jgi:hypothetical protein
VDRDWFNQCGECVMWTQIYDEQGRPLGPAAEELFFDELKKSYSLAAKIEMLDTNFNPIEDGNLRTKCICTPEGQLQNVITDGSIDVDRTRGTRRTAEFTILNPTAEFTPATGDFDPEGPWVGKVYLNRIVRTWRGLHLGHRHLYVPVGTFMIDIADVLVEQNMSLVNLTLSDLWKKLTKSYFGREVVYPENTYYNEIIRDLITPSGINLEGRMAANIDRLPTRDEPDKKTNMKVKFKEGDSRGDKLKELCDRWGIDAYFDPMGVFVTEDRRDPKDKKVAWTYASKPLDDDGRGGMLLSMRRSFNDDNLYNKVIIIGTGDRQGENKPPVRASREDNNPRSKTNIQLIGERVYLFSSDKISTQNEADRALDRAWRLRFQLSEEIESNVLVNPALEADDVIRFYEPDFAKIDGRYRLSAFNIPFVTSRQTLRASNIIMGEDL